MAGRIDLGLAESEFWELTPRHFRAMVDRQRENRERVEQRADLRAGVIAAAMRNAMGGKGNGSAYSAKDFFRFEQVGKTAPARPQKQDQKIVEAGWVSWARSMGVQPPAGLVIGGRRG